MPADSRKLIARSLGILEIFVATGAIYGGGALIATPSGRILGMPLDLLRGTPFRTFLIPGLLLCFIVGGGNLIAGWLAIRVHPSAPMAGIAAGGILSGWIATQIALIGYVHPIQAIYLLFGVSTVAIAAIWRVKQSPIG